jgi:cbb3-type cytochrome oxidase subunit 3
MLGVFEILILIQLIAWIAAVVGVMRDSSMKGNARLLWLLAIFIFPFVGVVAYFLFGRRRTSNRRSDDISPMDIHHATPDQGSTDDFSGTSHD